MPAPPNSADHGHAPVLMAETLELLVPAPGDVVVDLTAGRGGHALELARAVGPTGRVVLFDRDAENLAYASERCRDAGAPVDAIHDTFLRAPARLAELGVTADVVLADLGFSSNQMDDPTRGFSFRTDGPLDMRLDPSTGSTAANLIATIPESQLAQIIFDYGEDPFARKIARKIVAAREEMPIHGTAELARLVTEAYGGRAHSSRVHPATRTFMAVRIAVNDELGTLESLLEAIRRGAEAARTGGWLKPDARIAVISFHSLEDRLVKRAFVDIAQRDLAVRLTRKPRSATEQEVQVNARSRSAKLRAIRLSSG